MKREDLQQKVTRAQERAEEARRALDALLRDTVPSGLLRDVEKKRRAEVEAVKVLIVSELAAGIIDDPDATAAWLVECARAGEIIERTAAEDAW